MYKVDSEETGFLNFVCFKHIPGSDSYLHFIYLFQTMVARAISSSNVTLKENPTIYLCGCCFISVGKHHLDNCPWLVVLCHYIVHLPDRMVEIFQPGSFQLYCSCIAAQILYKPFFKILQLSAPAPSERILSLSVQRVNCLI